MKKFAVKIIILFVTVLAIDTVIGKLFHQLVLHAKGGDTGRTEYICHQLSEDLIVFGSSRAIHHYDPRILEDSLHLTTYNCGKNGNGIILSYGWYSLMRKHHQPKVIIYDIQPTFDLLAGDNMPFLPGLRYYYDESPVDSILWEVSSVERYKMLLNGYRYNSQFLQIIMDNIKPMRQDIKGYRPLQGEMNYEPVVTKSNQTKNYQYDALKLKYLERLVKECQAANISFIFAVSPSYKNTDDKVLAPVYELCERYNVPLINHYTDSTFNMEKSYFKDSGHMNEKGATAYTSAIISEIKSFGIDE